VPCQVHTPWAENSGFAVDVKAAHFTGNEFENRFFTEFKRFFA